MANPKMAGHQAFAERYQIRLLELQVGTHMHGQDMVNLKPSRAIAGRTPREIRKEFVPDLTPFP